MTTLYLIDVDQVSMVAERVTALTELAEAYLNTLLDLEALDAFPVVVALSCVRDHVKQFTRC